MNTGQVDGPFPSSDRVPSGAFLLPDVEAMVECKQRPRKLPVKLMWIER